MRKFKPAYLFYALSGLAFIAILIEVSELNDRLNSNDLMDFVLVFYFAFILLYGLMNGLMYDYYNRIQKPLSKVLSYINFAVCMIGFYYLFILLSTAMYCYFINKLSVKVTIDDIISSHSRLNYIFIYSSPFIILLSVFILLFSIFKARKKAQLIVN